MPIKSAKPQNTQSRDENDTEAGTPLSKLPHRTNVKTLRLDRFNVPLPLCRMAPGREPMIQQLQVRGLASNPGESMDACKRIVPLRQGVTLKSRRAARLLMRLVEREERWETSGHPPGCSPSKLGWNRAELFCHLYGAQSYE
ncbi:hypothetical protein TNCV_3244071 [Trichonephila clavipes]|nr:hypothetical protein TNCV_3244071 [Trichonephila clavipes]